MSELIFYYFQEEGHRLQHQNSHTMNNNTQNTQNANQQQQDKQKKEQDKKLISNRKGSSQNSQLLEIQQIRNKQRSMHSNNANAEKIQPPQLKNTVFIKQTIPDNVQPSNLNQDNPQADSSSEKKEIKLQNVHNIYNNDNTSSYNVSYQNTSRLKSNNNYDNFINTDRSKGSPKFVPINQETAYNSENNMNLFHQSQNPSSQQMQLGGKFVSTGQLSFAKISDRHPQFDDQQDQLEILCMQHDFEHNKQESQMHRIDTSIKSEKSNQSGRQHRAANITRKILKSASQIIGIKSQRMLTKRLNEQQQQHQQMMQLKKQESSSTLWGWVSLKKRIEALKYLMRNIEMSGMIQIVSKLKMAHMNIIEDSGSDYQIENKQNRNKQEELENLETFLAKISFFFLKLFRIFPTIPNNMHFVAFFKILLSVELVYQIFQLPLMLSFPDNGVNIFTYEHSVLRVWFILPFIFEILLNFNLSYYEHGERITSKFRIIARYLSNDFWWDFAGVLGSGFVFQDVNLFIIMIIFIIRFVKFKRMYDAIEEKFQLSLRFSVPYTLLNLFLSVTLVAHMCGCGFQWIGSELDKQGVNNWLKAKNLSDSSISDKYIASLYFAFITMITVGYGDIVPISNQERIFVIFMTFFSCGVFAYVISSIGELFEIAFQNESVFKQQKYEISNYMETRSINSELQTKVFQFLEMLKTKKKQEPDSGQGILDIINPKLKESIYQSYYGGHLREQRLFSTSFSQGFLELLSISCQEQVYGPGEFIFYQQENHMDYSTEEMAKFRQDSQTIYLIVKGEVLIFEEDSRSNQQVSRKVFSAYKTLYIAGECFGVKEFFCGIPYEFTAQSKTLTTVIKIQRQKFLEILQRFPKDYESFAFIRDEMIFSNPDKYTKCQPCNRYDHSLYKCPRMHYLKRKLTTIYKFLHSEPQERKKWSRKFQQKFHSVTNEENEVRKQLKIYRVKFVRDLKQIENKEKSQNDIELNLSQQSSDKGSKLQMDHSKERRSILSVENSPFNKQNKEYKRKSSNWNDIIKEEEIGSKFLRKKKKNDKNEPSEAESNRNIMNLAKQLNLESSTKSIVSKNPLETNKPNYKKSNFISEKQSSIVNKSNQSCASHNRSDSAGSKDLSGQQSSINFVSQEEELYEIALEEQDEMFYFKCPIIVWNDTKKKYELSSEEDDIQGNEAIQQFIENNFAMFLDSSGEIALPLVENDESIDSRPPKDIIIKTANSFSPTHKPSSLKNPRNTIKFNEAISEEEIIKLSANSLSIIEEMKKKNFRRSYSSSEYDQSMKMQGMQEEELSQSSLNGISLSKFSGKVAESEVLSEEYHPGQKDKESFRNMNIPMQQNTTIPHPLIKNVGFNLDQLIIYPHQQDKVKQQKIVTLDSIFRASKPKQITTQKKDKDNPEINTPSFHSIRPPLLFTQNSSPQYKIDDSVLDLEKPLAKRKTVGSRPQQTHLEKLKTLVSISQEYMTHMISNQLHQNNPSSSNNNSVAQQSHNISNSTSYRITQQNGGNVINLDQINQHQFNQQQYVHRIHQIQQQQGSPTGYQGMRAHSNKNQSPTNNIHNYLMRERQVSVPSNFKKNQQLEMKQGNGMNQLNQISLPNIFGDRSGLIMNQQQNHSPENNIEANNLHLNIQNINNDRSSSSSQSRKNTFLGKRKSAYQKEQKGIIAASRQTSMKQFHSQVAFSEKSLNNSRSLAVPPTTQINIRNRNNFSQPSLTLINNSRRYLHECDISEMFDFIFSFDKAGVFTKYYPKFNIGTIIKKYIKYQQTKIAALNSKAIQKGGGKLNPRGNIYRKKGNEKILLRGNEMGRGTERLIGGTERVITSK